ncbi:MAG: heterodisulfide reductase-related iron-sulfur binding cluster [Armatimonadota bacterium]|nr:heterodisulfide reductase-related iron-sulfur binding cluster [Armatimonadota bacterium]MDR5688893.1 heterodisulfide reductase-related iron-sulfur binding cluster [Armatimonadota bacterium]MDR7387372.1 heterodisulfide reductase-related iron-sulfur binding cluster [Armatimonadota bacterium]MDR7390005.1 heterodisulfide reductase-related iron-sulfur binding cluster [Armatimonadota bacterium]MDR7394183.1 heterodisulfide reductase-related iron-sulfur binding cluster [Armatimonadota bacterium]
MVQGVGNSRVFRQDPDLPVPEDVRERVLELEAEGEWVVQRVPEPYAEVPTKYGRTKKVPLAHTWHHKSCGQCGHIPGYSTAIFWLHRKLGLEYDDPRDQTSCTGWNYYASATSNAAAQAAVAARNFAAAYESGYFPLIHCGTSYGHYKEVREELVKHGELRRQVRDILGKLGRPFVMPEEIVHYSEWVYAVRHEIAARRVHDCSEVVVTVHPACHYYKLVQGDAIYDPDIYGGQRTAVVTAVAQALGAQVRDYSTWFDCCGFGFRHILVQRDFTRSFAVGRKIEVMVEEAKPDVVLTHDTGCVTTLDKSQFAAQVHNRKVGVPVMSEAQFAALAMGAHPYRVCQLHWHAADYRPLLEKMGIDWREKWREFEDDLERIRRGEKEYLTWEDVDAEVPVRHFVPAS